MEPGPYSIRPFAESDYEAVARLNSIYMPELPETAEDSRRWAEIVAKDPRRIMRKFVAEEVGSGSLVAWGGLTHTLFNFHPDKYFVRVVVDPAHRRRGVGQEMYSLLEREAVRRNAICLWCDAREDDPRSLSFFEHQGYVPTRKIWSSRLDLAELDLSQVPDRSESLLESGIRITTFAAEGADRIEVRRRLFELGRMTSADVPRLGDYSPVTFEEFVAIDLAGPNVLPDAIFIACDREEYVAWSTLWRAQGRPDSLDIGFTGTRREYRGRGIAAQLKRRAVIYARDHGYRFMVTGNDSLNPAIWSINQRLGFRRELVLVQAEKKLRSTGS